VETMKAMTLASHYTPFHTSVVDHDVNFSEHSASSPNDGGPDNWQYRPSFTTNHIVLETHGYMLARPVCRPLVTT
jgi:hypothetical protein